jgi:DNA-binding transcriptional LysR family regulator
MYIIPKTIARFRHRYPKIDIHLGIRDTREIEAGVTRNEFDFGFVGGHLAGDEIDVLPWVTDELVLIVPPTHALARKKSVKKADLEKERFIVRESGSATRATIARHLQEWELRLEAIMEMKNPESLKKAVQSGLGIAFISKFAIESELKAKILVTPRIPRFKISRQLKIVARKDKHLGHAARTFIQMANSERP